MQHPSNIFFVRATKRLIVLLLILEKNFTALVLIFTDSFTA